MKPESEKHLAFDEVWEPLRAGLEQHEEVRLFKLKFLGDVSSAMEEIERLDLRRTETESKSE